MNGNHKFRHNPPNALKALHMTRHDNLWRSLATFHTTYKVHILKIKGPQKREGNELVLEWTIFVSYINERRGKVAEN